MNFLPTVLHIFSSNNSIAQSELREESLFLSVAQRSHVLPQVPVALPHFAL